MLTEHRCITLLVHTQLLYIKHLLAKCPILNIKFYFGTLEVKYHLYLILYYILINIYKYTHIYIYITRVYANLADMIPSILVLDLPLDPPTESEHNWAMDVQFLCQVILKATVGWWVSQWWPWWLQCILGIIPRVHLFSPGFNKKTSIENPPTREEHRFTSSWYCYTRSSFIFSTQTLHWEDSGIVW